MNKMKRSFKLLYIGTIILFSVYILFLSDNGIRRHRELAKRIRDTENNLNKINNYIISDHNTKELMTDPYIREQYAREKLDMSKNNEDVFIFVYE
ncbi:septum formation initiator family protein [Bacteroidales bacterium OttesenSCG-928-E04]|nr:septum formation initiator family protein [Bacteroidales bacterium OttesenSCG-928-E04]